jgi:hypothetical protein
MRTSLAFLLVTTLAGCGGSGGLPADQPDAPMVSDSGFQPPTRGFQLVSPTVDIYPQSELTYCYYFHTSNTSDLSIQKWASHMTAGAHDMILYLTRSDLQTPGSFSTDKCGLASDGPGPVWTYSAQNPEDEVVLPSNDGHGIPVGQPVKADQSGFLQIHFLNTTSAVLHAHVELNAYAYADGVQVTSAAPFFTLNTQINLPAATQTPTTGTVSGNCDVTSDVKFFAMTTHTHKQGVHTFIKDGATTVFDSTNWEHPTPQTWSASPFFSFTSGKLTYQCEYVNPNSYQIKYGDSVTTQEMCMAIGYYFPAVDGTGHLCLNSVMLN